MAENYELERRYREIFDLSERQGEEIADLHAELREQRQEHDAAAALTVAIIGRQEVAIEKLTRERDEARTALLELLVCRDVKPDTATACDRRAAAWAKALEIAGPLPPPAPCVTCDGERRVEYVADYGGAMADVEEPCPTCNPTGALPRPPQPSNPQEEGPTA